MLLSSGASRWAGLHVRDMAVADPAAIWAGDGVQNVSFTLTR